MDKKARELSAELEAKGFKFSNERVEYHLSVSEWPGEVGTPLSWTTASVDGALRLEQAAELLGRAGQGDPDWSPEDDPLQLLKSYLAEGGLYGGLNAVQVGLVDGRPAGVVVAQANPATGWCRITYMGLLPEFRGRGLGRWLHRHGFAMMKGQGGKQYHGGTVSTNAAMIRLFLSQGCQESRRMEEWIREF
ncbi:MAG: GNAT family N-acetyltransferase [Elusimicrobia bacterium]|nr:GNAT family N-acetyltransferase [Elusimicrobiota bacterium]